MESGNSSASAPKSAENRFLHPDQLELISVFNARGIKFLLVGGHAYSAYAATRATKDINLWLSTTPENAAAVYAALAEYGAPLRDHGVKPSDFAEEGCFYQLGLPPARIDLLTEMAGINFDEAYARCLKTTLAGLPVGVISLDDLIHAKTVAGRPRDLLDVQDLLQVKARKPKTSEPPHDPPAS